MEILFNVFYLIIFGIIILKSKLFASKTISKQFILFVFFLKVVISYLYGYLAFKNNWGDTFAYFESSKIFAKLLPNHPLKFLRLIFGNTFQQLPLDYQQILGLKDIRFYGYRNDMLLKMNAFLQIFSFGFYSIHCIFFAFLSLFGLFHIYEFFSKPIHQTKLNLLKIFLFFTPSLLYWGSGVHKDALVFFSLGLLFFTINKVLKHKLWWVLPFFISCAFAYLTRNYTYYLFGIAISAFTISGVLKKPVFVYSIVYILTLLLFLFGERIHSDFDFLETFTRTQEHFQSLDGGSQFNTEVLEPNSFSFAETIPKAFFRTLFIPNLNDTHNLVSTLAVVENFALIFIGFLLLFNSSLKKIEKQTWNYILFCFFFAITYYTLIGLVVNFSGALVRYKATGLLFMGISLILITDNLKIFKYKFLKPLMHTK